jgi:hypothetical protein
VKTARQEYSVALKSGDPEQCVDALKKYDKAKEDFYMTPRGQKYLIQKIRKTGDPDGTLAFQQEYGKMAREEAMNEVRKLKLTDTHSEAYLNEVRARKLDKRDAEHANLEKEKLKAENELRKVRGQMPVSKFQNLALDKPTAGYSSYDASLTPQASDLDRVAASVDAISNGANTSSALGESFNVTQRDANYYANAAEYIGLVRKGEAMDGVHEYELTENGHVFREADAQTRVEMLKELTYTTPLMKEYQESGRDRATLEQAIRDSGYEDATAKRRASALISWDKKLGSPEFVNTVSNTSEQAKTQSLVAAENLRKERAAKLMKQPVERSYGVCNSCFTTLPATGVCSNCDD